MSVERRVFALDLKDDPALWAEYEARHRPGAVWPEVVRHLRASGYRAMTIHRVDDRLVMIADVDTAAPSIPPPPLVDAWEAAMDAYQQPIRADGPKWLEMTTIFDLSLADDGDAHRGE